MKAELDICPFLSPSRVIFLQDTIFFFLILNQNLLYSSFWDQLGIDMLLFGGLPGGSGVKNPPANTGHAGPTPGWEDPLKEGKATHSSILAWRIP